MDALLEDIEKLRCFDEDLTMKPILLLLILIDIILENKPGFSFWWSLFSYFKC